MKTMFKRLLVVVLCICMVLPLIPAVEADAASGYTLYFEAPSYWDYVYFYYWSDLTVVDGYTEWPGQPMTYVSGNIYSCVVPYDAECVIFNNATTAFSYPGIDQTYDLVIPGGNMIYSWDTEAWSTYGAHTHSWDAGVITSAATCAKAGVKTYTCSGCGTTRTESIPALSTHSWDAGVVTKTATCTSGGTKVYTCNTCRTTKTETLGVLGHKYASASAINCSRCGLSRSVPVLKKVDGVWKSYVAGEFASLTALVDLNGVLYYVKNGILDTSYKGLFKYDNTWYYVKDGKVATGVTDLVKYNNEWWYVVKGKVASSTTGLVKYNGEWWYVVKGKLASQTTTLVKYNGEWFYVIKGKMAGQTTSLVKYNNEWWYVVKGKVASSTTGLVKYNGEWWYVVKGKLASQTTTLVKYNGEWFYVIKGKMAGQTTSLVKYNNEWWYIVKGKIAAKTTALVEYSGSRYYVVKGKMAGQTTTLVKYADKWYYVEKGCVSNKSTLCLFNGVWYYVNNGTTQPNATTLCPYGDQWYYVKNGVFSKSTLFFRFHVDNVNYYVKDGVVMTGTSGKVVVGGQTYYIRNGALTDCHTNGHSWQYSGCTSPKSCSKCTVTNGTAPGHSWKNATCTSPKTCSTCGVTNGSALGHSYSGTTCTRCGQTQDGRTYLCNWLMRNGTYSDGYYHYICYPAGKGACTVSYDYADDALYVGCKLTTDDAYSITTLSIDSGDFIVSFNSGVTCKIYGHIYPSSYTQYSTHYFTDYEGYTALYDSMKQLAVSGVPTTVTCLEYFLNNYVSGVTLADLGYKSF